MSDLVLWNHPDAKAVESQLTQLSPRFADVLAGVMPPARLIRTVMVSLDRTPKLFECNRQTIYMAAMSAACLGLEVDGVTGQGFILPFKGRAQLVTGYKGYNTLGARGSYAIRGAVVREGEAFEFDEAEGKIVHRRKLGNTGRIVGAWARAVSSSLPPFISVLSIDELLAVMKRAPGSRTSDSPWNDEAIGFPAMCEKTAKRRLARSMPLNVQFQLAARMDEAHEEQGKYAHITKEKGLLVEDAEVISPIPPPQDVPPPTVTINSPERFPNLPHELARKAAALIDYLNRADPLKILMHRWQKTETTALLEQIKRVHPPYVEEIREVFDVRRKTLVDAERTA